MVLCLLWQVKKISKTCQTTSASVTNSTYIILRKISLFICSIAFSLFLVPTMFINIFWYCSMDQRVKTNNEYISILTFTKFIKLDLFFIIILLFIIWNFRNLKTMAYRTICLFNKNVLIFGHPWLYCTYLRNILYIVLVCFLYIFF